MMIGAMTISSGTGTLSGFLGSLGRVNPVRRDGGRSRGGRL